MHFAIYSEVTVWETAVLSLIAAWFAFFSTGNTLVLKYFGTRVDIGIVVNATPSDVRSRI